VTDEIANTVVDTDCQDEFETLLAAQNNLEQTIVGLMASVHNYLGALETRMKRIEQNFDDLVVASLHDCPGQVN